MCDPLPRTINRGSPPTERNARTGEFTPPGIMLSALNWRRRDCSVLRDGVDGIESSRRGEIRCQQIEPLQATTIAARRSQNSSDIHRSAIPLQHGDSTVESSSRPSNREGFEGQSRGLRTVLISFPRTCAGQGCAGLSVWGRVSDPAAARSAAGSFPFCYELQLKKTQQVPPR